MPYIGRSTITGNYVKCSTLTPDGSTTTFTLTNSIDSSNVYPGSENSMIVSVSGVIQAPGDAYTINNNQIVFSAAPEVSDTIDFIIVLGDLVSIGTPSDGTVTSSKLASGFFSTDKSNTGDGSTTAFTINSNRTVNDILVIVNGIVLTPTDDYTVSGTTLTFTSAPAASAGIVIRYLG